MDIYKSKPSVKNGEVVRYFFFLEADSNKYKNRKQEILAWCNLSDDDVIEKAINFAKERLDENPTIAWTVGTETNHYYKKIDKWVLEQVDLKSIYSCGINPKVKKDLDDVSGNLSKFEEKHSKKYKEFSSNPVPNKFSILIVIAHSKNTHDGSFEIIDGVHRTISMLRNNINQSHAYIGILKKHEKY